MSSAALVRMDGGQIAERPNFDLAEIQQIGQIFVKSGFFQDSKDASQAIVKIMAGAEMGFGPMASMSGIYIVKGKVSISANLMAAAIKRSRKYDFKVRELTSKRACIEFFEGKESIGVSEFTIEDAQSAGLSGSETYKKFPKNMLFSRCMSNGVKFYCADIFAGPVYTPDELGADADEEGNFRQPQNTEPAEKNVTRTYPDIKPVETVREGGRVEKITQSDCPVGLGIDAGLIEWAVRTKGEKAGQAFFDGFLSKKTQEEKEAFAVKNGIRWTDETVIVVEQPTREDFLQRIEAQIAKLDKAMGPTSATNLVMKHTQGEEYDTFDLQALQSLSADLASDLTELGVE